MSLKRKVAWQLWKICHSDFDDDYCKWAEYVNSHDVLVNNLISGYLETHVVPIEDVDQKDPCVIKYCEVVDNLLERKNKLLARYLCASDEHDTAEHCNIRRELENTRENLILLTDLK